MKEINVYNLDGVILESLKLNEFIFGLPVKEELVQFVYKAQMNNRRLPWAHSKDKSEVRGGGKKPWKQKGTGRARHGSIRSPLWTGGGVTFGPLNIRNYKQKINKKVNSQVVRMCLSDKVETDRVVLFDELKSDGKTKTMVNILKKISIPELNYKKTLVVLEKIDERIRFSFNNISNIELIKASDVSVVDLLHSQYVLLDKNSIDALEKRFNVNK